MGVVYKAYQRSLKRLVALKMVSNHQDASYDTVARFSIEAAATAKLTHPNIVRIHDAVADADPPRPLAVTTQASVVPASADVMG